MSFVNDIALNQDRKETAFCTGEGVCGGEVGRYLCSSVHIQSDYRLKENKKDNS